MVEAWYTSIDALRAHGFQGFITMRALRDCKLDCVPASRGDVGVYVAFMADDSAPIFLPRSTGGRFKGKDPNVSGAELSAKWVRGTRIVYLGKAGPSPDRTLRKRLGEYLAFGAGKSIGHWGGRYLWHLPKSDDLVVCWKLTPNEDPGDVEGRMLDDFEAKFGALPFANLRH